MDKQIIRKPHERQVEALKRTEKEILYGGARGGGKTDCGINWLLYDIDNPKLRALVLRESYNDLVDRIDRAMVIYSQFGAKKIGNPVEIIFPSGAKIRTGYLKGQSYDKYKGHEYQRMLIEELTQIPGEDSYEKLLGSLRSTVPGLDPQIFLTTNPDGVGRLWVKRRFVDVVKPGQTYSDSEGNTRIFIPAKVEDNPTILENDPGYIKYLDGIKDDQLRKARREGDREAYDIKGGIYTSQIKQARREERIYSVPLEVNTPVNTVWDLGFNDYTTIIFYQVVNREVRIIDTYHNNGELLSHYWEVIKSKANKGGYTLGRHYGPHDTRNSNLVGSPHNQARELGFSFDIIERSPDKWADINKARAFFAYCHFDQEKARTLIEHLELYRQERDEKHQIFKNRPYHGPESHFADAFRYLAVTVDLRIRKRVKYKPINWEKDYR